MGYGRGRRVETIDKHLAVALIDEAIDSGCRMKIACTELDVDFKSYLRWKNGCIEDQRKGPLTSPANKLSEAVKEQIIAVANSNEFKDESPWIIVSKLADAGEYIASESSFYKVLKEKKLLVHRGKSRPKSNNRPLPLLATAPKQIWSWDISYLQTEVKGIYYYLYLFLDVFSRKIVGFDIYDSESMDHSAEIFHRICYCEKISPHQLTLHADNGHPMKGATMLATMQKLGVVPSFNRPRVSNDNPYSESLFKTIKYHHKYPGRFKTIDEAKSWVRDFVHWYNNVHLHSGIKFVTPEQRHTGIDREILNNRRSVYQKARDKFPERWSGRKIKNFDYQEKVYLNYLQEQIECNIKMVS